MNEALKKAEDLLFNTCSSELNYDNLPMIFIIASPRTGSTLFYQIMINFFEVFYFSNYIHDYFAEFPVVGAALDLILNPHNSIEYKSSYGKIEGFFEPSEGSYIFKNWFGGEQPSQLYSAKVLPEKKQRMLLTIKSIYKLTNKPILTKNAWNCFRIKELSTLFKSLYFIWFRRDIGLSAFSDLESRYRRGAPEVWNSATTANYKEIQKLPYWEQVVEQQYEYNKAIEHDLKQYAPERYLKIWYEDICDHFETEIDKIKQFYISKSFPIKSRESAIPNLKCSNSKNKFKEDRKRIFDYIYNNPARFKGYIRTDISFE